MLSPTRAGIPVLLLLVGLGTATFLLLKNAPREPQPVAEPQPDSSPATAWTDAEEPPDPSSTILDPSREVLGSASEVLLSEAERRALGTLRGRVVAEDGQSVQGFSVELFAASSAYSRTARSLSMPNSVRVRKFTDQDGSFQFNALDSKVEHVLWIDREGPRAKHITIHPFTRNSESRDLGTIQLPAPSGVVGRLLDEDGEPVSGASILGFAPEELAISGGRVLNVWRDTDGGSWRAGEIHAVSNGALEQGRVQTISGNDGTFSIGRILRTADVLHVVHASFLETLIGPFRPEDGQTIDVGDITLDRGVSLIGRVLTASGAPASRARIFVGTDRSSSSPDRSGAPMSPSDMNSLSSERRSVPTLQVLPHCAVADASGRFTISGLGNEDLIAALSSGNSGLVVQPLNLEDRAQIEMRLGETRDLEIQISAEGELLEDAPKIQLLDITDGTTSSVRGRLMQGEPGWWMLRDLDPAPYLMTIDASGFARATKSIDLKDGSSKVKVDLSRGHDLDLAVLDLVSGEPIANALLSLKHSSGRDPLAKDEQGVRPALATRNPQHLRVLTDREGRTHIPHLPAGSYFFAIDHVEFLRSTVSIELPGDPVEIRLSRGGRIACLGSSDGGLGVPRLVHVKGERFSHEVVLTAPNGAFEIDRLSPGDYEVAIEKLQHLEAGGSSGSRGGSRRSSSPMSENVQTIIVEEGKTTTIHFDSLIRHLGVLPYLKGRLLINGVARPNVLVELSAADASTWVPVGWKDAARTMTNSEGEFDFGAVPPGVVFLRACQTDPSSTGELGTVAWARAEVGRLREQYVELKGRTGTFSGQVVDQNNSAPVAGAYVTIGLRDEDWRLLAPEWLNTCTDHQGRFWFKDVPLGQATVRVSHESFASYEHSGNIQVLTGGQTSPLTVELETGVVVAGTVLFPSQMDRSGMRLFMYLRDRSMRSDSGSWRWKTRRGCEVDVGTGAFMLNHVYPGVYEADFDCVRAICPLKGVRLVIPPGGIEGVVLEAELDERWR